MPSSTAIRIASLLAMWPRISAPRLCAVSIAAASSSRVISIWCFGAVVPWPPVT